LSHSRCVLPGVLAAVALAIGLQARAQANAPRSAITIHVHKSGLFSAFAHDHTVTAPVASGAIDTKALRVEIIFATKQMQVVDPGDSDKERAEIQSTMLGPKVLDADKYPEIRFASTHVDSLGLQRYRVTGKLELHGASREMTFDVTGGPDQYQGKTKLKQTDFRIEPVTVAGGTVKVKDELEIEFTIYGSELAAGNQR